jgi:hypothetical protein
VDCAVLDSLWAKSGDSAGYPLPRHLLHVGCCRFRRHPVRVESEPEVDHEGKAAVHARVQGWGSQAGEGRGGSVAKAEQDLDVLENLLGRWVREFGADAQFAFPGKGVMKPEQARLSVCARKAQSRRWSARS